jgi:hypothetical protein
MMVAGKAPERRQMANRRPWPQEGGAANGSTSRRQNNPNTNKTFRWSFSAISHQLSFDVAKKEKAEGAKSGE